MAKEKITSVSWKARSYLTDVELMDRLVECTYFRILNYIYLTQDQLPDDDEKLARLCKCKTVKEYRAHKAELLKDRGIDPETGEKIPPRITISDGFIRSEKCTEQLGFASKNRAQKSKAGTASAQAKKGGAKTAKSPHSIYKESTAAGTANATGTPTASQRQAQRPANGDPDGPANGGPTTLTLTSLSKEESPLPPKGGEVDFEALFEARFWPAYPSRGEAANPKKPARLKFIAACKRGVDPERIIAGAKAYAANATTKVGTEFVATAVVWLSQDRWEQYASSDAPARVNGVKVEGHNDIPTVVPGFPADTQIEMAKGYLLEGRNSNDLKTTTWVGPKPPNARRWFYKPHGSTETFPPPGAPGCPVHPLAFEHVAKAWKITDWRPEGVLEYEPDVGPMPETMRRRA